MNTEWVEPKFGNSEINRAGEILRRQDTSSTDDLAWAYEVVDNWRASHAFPLNSVQIALRRRARELDKKALVAQRLKRVPSILKKLETQSTMRLSQMQDIGGCRAVLRTLRQVVDLRGLYRLRRSAFELVGEKNYIDNPKTSGYRSIHLVYKYRGQRSDSRSVYDGHHIEIQIRSQLQHSWATAVETVGTIVGAALKASERGPTSGSIFSGMSALSLQWKRAPQGCPILPHALF